MKAHPLLVIDAQKAFAGNHWGPPHDPRATGRMRTLIETWRAVGWPLWHVRHHSTEARSPLRPRLEGAEFIDGFGPRGRERVFTKNVNSAFIGTDLARALRAGGHRRVTLIGFTADHCVSTTARMAANLGFGVTVAGDATLAYARRGADGRRHPAALVHAVSLASLHGEFATVRKTREITRALPANPRRHSPSRHP